MAFIQDECIRNIYLAQEAMKDWIPMTEYEMIYEAATDPVMAAKAKNNAEVAEKGGSFVGKAIQAVITMINKLITSITDFVQRCTMSGEERKAFDAYREACKKDPSLKNKKITVKDFRQTQAQYEQMVKEVETEIKAVKADGNHPIDAITKKVNDFLGNAVGGVKAVFATDLGVKIAESNIQAAKVISTYLNNSKTAMQELSKSLGDKEAAKFKKRVDNASKETILNRLKIRIFHKQYESLEDCIKSTAQTLSDIPQIGQLIGGNKDDKMRALKAGSMANKLVKSTGVGDAVAPVAKDVKKGIISGAKDYAKRRIVDKVKPVDDIERDEHQSIVSFVRGKKKK
jgi:hypothetical protein